MRIALAQLDSGADRAANLARIRDLAATAAADGARLLLLPEACTYRGDPSPDLVEGDDGPVLRALAGMAAAHRIAIVVGGVWTPSGDPARPYNTSLVIDRTGRVRARYHKVHLFRLHDGELSEDEARTTTPGDTLVTATVDGWTYGLSICYDLRFPELYRALARDGADVLLVPANFAAATGAHHWEPLLRSRAIENLCYVAAPAQTGVAPDGFVSHGHSALIDPWGTVVARAGDEPALLIAELSRARLVDRRAALAAPREVRPEVYARPAQRAQAA
jgi:predicted amidohydrolase